MTLTHFNKYLAASGIAIVLCVAPAFSQNAGTAPDNTAVNKQDRDPSQPTADQAKNKTADRKNMQEIRKAVVEDKSLSTYAHNVKIISQNGKVTLKGPVRSEDEKHTIEAKATEVAGQGNVENQLTVRADKNAQ